MVHIEYYQVQTTTSSSYFNSPSVLLILDGQKILYDTSTSFDDDNDDANTDTSCNDVDFVVVLH